MKSFMALTVGAIIFFFLGFGFAFGSHHDKEGNKLLTHKSGDDWNPAKQFMGDALFAGEGWAND